MIAVNCLKETVQDRMKVESLEVIDYYNNQTPQISINNESKTTDARFWSAKWVLAARMVSYSSRFFLNQERFDENAYFLSKTSRLQRARSPPSDIRSRQKTYLDIAADEISRLRYVLNEKVKSKVPIWAEENLIFKNFIKVDFPPKI